MITDILTNILGFHSLNSILFFNYNFLIYILKGLNGGKFWKPKRIFFK